MDENKIQDMAYVAVEKLIDEIRNHREQCGLDPDWYPSEEWATDKFLFFIQRFKSI